MAAYSDIAEAVRNHRRQHGYIPLKPPVRGIQGLMAGIGIKNALRRSRRLQGLQAVYKLALRTVVDGGRAEGLRVQVIQRVQGYRGGVCTAGAVPRLTRLTKNFKKKIKKQKK